MIPKQQSILIAGVLGAVLLIAGSFFFLAKPQLAERNKSRTASADAAAAAASLRSQLTDLERKQTDLPAAQAQVDDLFRKFPNSYQQGQWVQMIISVAASTHVKVTSITPMRAIDASQQIDPATGQPLAAALPQSTGTATGTTGTPAAPVEFPLAQSQITLVAEGSVSDLDAFLAALESMERPMLIDSVALSSASDDGGNASVSITGKTFLSRPLDTPVLTTPTTEAP